MHSSAIQYRGAKRSILCDGGGLPLGLEIAGANVTDFKLLPQGLCLDRGCDYPEVYDLLDELGLTGHVRSRGEEKKQLEHDAASALAAGSSSAPTPGSTASAAS